MDWTRITITSYTVIVLNVSVGITETFYFLHDVLLYAKASIHLSKTVGARLYTTGGMGVAKMLSTQGGHI